MYDNRDNSVIKDEIAKNIEINNDVDLDNRLEMFLSKLEVMIDDGTKIVEKKSDRGISR